MKEKIKISIPVLVEGKYDKIRLSNIIDANIVTTDGFGVFNDKEKQVLIKRLSENGIIIITDSDRAGSFIRSAISNYIPKDKIYNLYTPQIEGKERRKTMPSKDGLLGVEGINDDVLYAMFDDFVKRHGMLCEAEIREPITKVDFYEARLTGFEDSNERRNKLCEKIGLPQNMTPNALLSALNTLFSKKEFLDLIE